MPGTNAIRVSVVIPVYNGAQTLPTVLAALKAAAPAAWEVIVVDDASTDNSGELGAQAGCHVVRVEQNSGAAAAKNCGAAQARGEVLFFTDADIVVPPDIFSRLIGSFENPSVHGVVGMLGLEIPAANLASQFKNLWMNYTYSRFSQPGQNGGQRIGLFYTSVAAMRRSVFERLGGFDSRYRGTSIAEDMEFGQRAWARGYNVRLDPRLQVKHLKTYTFRGLLIEDFRRARALTLMRLRNWRQPFFTSVPSFFQLAVLTILLAIGALLLALASQTVSVFFLSMFLLLLFYLLNRPLLAFLLRARGPGFLARVLIVLPLDAIASGLGMMKAVLDFSLGDRY